MAKQGKKSAKRLAARVKEWESMKDSATTKDKKGMYNELWYHKPGSNRK